MRAGSGRLARHWPLVVLAVAAACDQSVFSATDPEVQLETPLVWAGTQIVLTSAALQGSDTLPLVLLGDDTVVARYAAPDSIIFAAPDSQGTFPVRIGFRGRGLLPAGTVRVGGGFGGWRDIAGVGGFPLRWPGGGPPSFAIAGPAGLDLVDPRFWTTSPLLPDSVFSQTCTNGPGPALGGRVAVSMARDNLPCGPAVALRPDDPGFAPDTGPPAGGARFAVQLGPTRWLEAYHHTVKSYARDSGGLWWPTILDFGGTYGVAVSPRGDRAILIGANGIDRATPVFTPASAQPAYELDQFTYVMGAQFSDDGDTLFLAGWPTDYVTPPPSLAAIRASDGEVLRSAPVWTAAENLVLDPGRPWLYLVGYPSWNSGPAVQVVDRATFAPVATLAVPSGTLPSLRPNNLLYPMLSAWERKLYLVETCPWCTAGEGTRIFVFDLLP